MKPVGEVVLLLLLLLLRFLLPVLSFVAVVRVGVVCGPSSQREGSGSSGLVGERTGAGLGRTRPDDSEMVHVGDEPEVPEQLGLRPKVPVLRRY